MMANNEGYTFKIPEGTSSLMAATHRQRIVHLTRSSNELKRKASTLSLQSATASTEFIDTQIELARNDYELYTAMFRGLKEVWEAGNMSGEDFKVQGKGIWRKRTRLNKERTTLQQDRNNILERMNKENPKILEAYKTAITTSFASKSAPPATERRDRHTHDEWKRHLRSWYNATQPLEPGQDPKDRHIWCPILKRFYSAKYRCAAHIVPHFMGYENVAWMLGEEGDIAEGSHHIWDFRNGVVMAKALEKQFDEGDFVIVPIPTAPNEPQRLRFVLINTAYSHHGVGEWGPHYSELDGTELEFRGTARPGLRYLYWHYVTSILRAIKWEKTGWKDLKAKFPDGPIWATPGPYLRRSMLRHLAQAIGDYDLNDKEFEEGVCWGAGHKPSTDEEAIAAEVADKLEIDPNDESDDDETEDEFY